MNYVEELDLKKTIETALEEDIGRRDLTTEAFIKGTARVKASVLAKQECVVCGLFICAEVFKTVDPSIKFTLKVQEGLKVKKGTVLALVEGRAKGILTAERVALNFLSLLCAVATKTRKFVDAARPFKARILDTRKTIPGLRLLEKYAVRIGGGHNHRFKLDEMAMLKDNHLKVIGDRFWSASLKDPGVQIEIEVSTLGEFRKALKLKPDIIMLDNMSLKEMKKAVAMRECFSPAACCCPSPKLEASGNITLRNIKRVAATGVDTISIGALTHSIDSVDLSLEIL
jgi:nicotinate-nucleotide pyrophosphorylase (carboxylating)